jgi:hypothetical protein
MLSASGVGVHRGSMRCVFSISHVWLFPLRSLTDP